MGAINIGSLTNKSRLAIANEPRTEEEEKQQDFFNYPMYEANKILDKYKLYYYRLIIKSGYYNGFYLELNEKNTKYVYNNTKEKNEVAKELTLIKKCLVEIVKNGYCWGCLPSWIYNRQTTTETIKQIKTIIKELKTEIKASYTARKATQQGKTIFDIIREVEG